MGDLYEAESVYWDTAQRKSRNKVSNPRKAQGLYLYQIIVATCCPVPCVVLLPRISLYGSWMKNYDT